MSPSETTPQDNLHQSPPIITSRWLSKAVFLGTGTSGQVPAIHCLLEEKYSDCKTCQDAILVDSKNRRGCTCLAVLGKFPNEKRQTTILIDCGKTFYSNAISQFPKNGIKKIDAVLLTHNHADAILGLDDLRAWTMGNVIQPFIDIYLTQDCMKTVTSAFPYLVDKRKATGGGDVVSLRWNIIDASKPFTIQSSGQNDIQIQPLPVLHGYANQKPFPCLGYKIHELSYISDCHHIPSSTVKLLEGTKVLILDALKYDRHLSHFSLSQALSFLASFPFTQRIELGLLTDISHRIEHHRAQNEIDMWRAGLLEWQSTTTTTTTIGSDGLEDLGEATGPRWWSQIWDETECETNLTLTLKRNLSSMVSPLQIQQWNATVPFPIPPIKVAFDGLVIQFDAHHTT